MNKRRIFLDIPIRDKVNVRIVFSLDDVQIFTLQIFEASFIALADHEPTSAKLDISPK